MTKSYYKSKWLSLRRKSHTKTRTLQGVLQVVKLQALYLGVTTMKHNCTSDTIDQHITLRNN